MSRMRRSCPGAAPHGDQARSGARPVGGGQGAGARDPTPDRSFAPARPGTRELVPRDATGAAAGVARVSPRNHQVALFTDALPRLSQGGYGCYFERAGQRTWIGPMQSAEGVQFWAGDMADSIEMTAGDKLVVAEDASAPSMLSAS